MVKGNKPNQIQVNTQKLFKSLKVKSKREFLELDNRFEVIEKAIIRLYNNRITKNNKRDKPILESSIYQQYFSKLRANSRVLGQPLNFKIHKTPKNPSSSIVKLNSKKISNYQDLIKSMSLESLKNNKEVDIDKIKSEVRDFLIELKEKSEKWFIFFLIKLNIGLDYSDICNLKISNFEPYLNRLAYTNKRHKTKVNATSFLSKKTINYYLKYVEKLSKIHGNDSNFNLFNSDNNKIDKYQPINSDSVRNTVKKITNNYIHSKDLRSLTKHLITENCGLDIVKREVLSQIWLAHKSDISNQYIRELRNGNFVYNLYLERIERFFDEIIP